MGLTEIITCVNWVDVLIIILLYRISYVGFCRGLSGELIPLIGTFTAFIVSQHFYLRWGDILVTYTPLSRVYSKLLAFIILAVLIRLFFIIIEGFVIGRIITVHIASLSGRLAGLIAGAMRGVLLIFIILMALDLAPFNYIDYSLKEKSLMGGKFLKFGRFTHGRITYFLNLKNREATN